ncbi:MAG: anthranilate synthase component I [Lachnospiraceae bacterium]|nr:anthranilate synthase component I [Lachnospiraceae bacterium]
MAEKNNIQIYPAKEEVEALAASGRYGVIPVYTQMYADMATPVEVVKKLKKVSEHVFLLESAEDNKRWGRYTFIGYEPKLEIVCRDGKVQITRDGSKKISYENPRACIRQLIEEYKSPQLEELPSFSGGLVGYFSYDFIKYSEPSLDLDARDTEQFQDVNLMLFDKLVCFDNYQQKIFLIQNLRTEEIAWDYEHACEQAYQQAKETLADLKNLIINGEKAEDKPFYLKSEFKPLFSEDEYCHMVERAKEYIREGDIFQVVLSNRMEAEMEGSLLDVYRVLRTQNPSPYMFYFSGEDGEIAGASPETLVKLEGEKLYTFPLAGTRKRGADREEDERLEAELLKDEKELAEHNMLVDLGRNDLGKISEIGSVQVEKYMSIHRYSHVMHIGSTVSGTIRKDKDALDAVDAVLPAGTLSGAPKIRACQIINELENNKRGIYGGAIGYLSFTGGMDTCIAIRLAFSKNGKVYVRAGAGIVADSVPLNEYRECLQKAAAVVKAADCAKGGI